MTHKKKKRRSDDHTEVWCCVCVNAGTSGPNAADDMNDQQRSAAAGEVLVVNMMLPEGVTNDNM